MAMNGVAAAPSAREIASRLEAWDGAEVDVVPDACFERIPRPAAVLVPLLWAREQWRVLFIKRAANPCDYHSGQVAFPGGAQEPTDAGAEAAALRETLEEIGLDTGQARVLGRLRTLRTISNFLVTPVVAQIAWPVELHPDPAEVSHVFTVPLAWLADPAMYRIQDRVLGNCVQPIPVVYYRPYRGEILWGVSARITLDLVKALRIGGATM